MKFFDFMQSRIILIFLVTLSFNLNAQVSIDKGKTLFTANCASCHAKNMKSALTGPALGGVEAKWDTKENLYAWIRNSQAMIKTGHPRAVEVWNQYKPTVMTSFPALTDDDLASILVYIDGVYQGTYPPKPAGAVAGTDTEVGDGNSKWFYPGVIAFLLFLAYLLWIVIDNLNKLSAAKDGRPYKSKTTWQHLTSKGVVSFLIFAAVISKGVILSFAIKIQSASIVFVHVAATCPWINLSSTLINLIMFFIPFCYF